MKKTQVAILGGGLAGLSAAIECQKQELDYILIEKDNTLGGQLKTERINDFILDKGFQVLSTRYPMAKKLLNYKQLNLKYFNSGARCWTENSSYLLYNPLNHFLKYIKTQKSSSVSIKDIIKLSSLFIKFVLTTDQYLFKEKEKELQTLLSDNTFSSELSETFFKPFFRGVFLDKELVCSSRLFNYYLKNFFIGKSAIPENGIQAIPQQLSEHCNPNNILLNQTVQSVKNNVIRTNHTEIKADFIISALDGLQSSILFNFPKPFYNNTQNFYFYSQTPIDNLPLINLNSSEGHRINNFYCVSNVNPSASPKNTYLYSLSVVNENEDIHETDIQKEAKKLLGKQIDKWIFLKSYSIKKAVLKQRTYKNIFNTRYNKKNLYFCGDWTMQGSIQGAMQSGILAVTELRKKLKK